MFGLYVLSAFLTFLAEFITVSISARFSYDMRERVKAKLDRLPLSYFDKVPYGDTLSIGTNDVDNISRNLTQIITQIFVSVTMFLGTIIAMFSVKWQLALVALASLPFTLAIVTDRHHLPGRGRDDPQALPHERRRFAPDGRRSARP